MLDRYIRQEQDTWIAFQQAFNAGDIMTYTKLLYSNIYASAKSWNRSIDIEFARYVNSAIISITNLKSYPKIFVKLQRLITNYELTN